MNAKKVIVAFSLAVAVALIGFNFTRSLFLGGTIKVETDIVLSQTGEIALSHGKSFSPNDQHVLKDSLSGASLSSFSFEYDEYLSSLNLYVSAKEYPAQINGVRIEYFGESLELSGKDYNTYFRKSIGYDVNENGVITQVNTLLGRPFKFIGNEILTNTINRKARFPAFLIAIGLAVLTFIITLKYSPFNLNQTTTYQASVISSFVIIVMFLAFSEGTYSTKEKRPLAEFPEVSFKKIFSFPREFANYTSDHFPFKNELLTVNNFLKIKVSQNSSRPSSVAIGKDQYLFTASSQIVPKVNATELFTHEELERVKSKLTKRSDSLKAQGTSFYILLVPVKHSIYPEMLPSRLRKLGPTNKVEQFIQMIESETDINLITTHDVILNAKKLEKHNLYYKTDTHWNQLGAHYAYMHIVDVLRNKGENIKPAHPLSDYEIVYGKHELSGDLLNLLSLNDYFSRQPAFLQPKYTPQAHEIALQSTAQFNNVDFLSSNYFYETGDTTKPNILLFRDSFCSYLKPHLSEHFNRSSYYWVPTFQPEIVAHEKPDIVIHEVLERFVDNLAK